MSTIAIVLAVLAAVCLLAGLAIPALKRATRWVDATLQTIQRPTVPAPTTTTDQKENPAA
jgi:hypothetical protein